MTDTRTITAAEVTPIIQAVVAEFGEDYRYQYEENVTSCFYRTPHLDEDGLVEYTDGPARCIVGQVLDRLGVLPAKLYTYDREHTVGDATALENLLAGQIIRTIEQTQDVVFTPAIVSALTVAQSRQDNRDTWGSALGEYEHSLRMAGELDD